MARSTIPDDAGSRALRRARAGRRVLLGALAVFVLLGATGVLGVRTATVSSSEEGYEVTVSYAAVSRPALASPWVIEVRRDGGFDGDVTLALRATYLELFDWNTLVPVPAEERRDGDTLFWTFTEPGGEVLRVSFDGRLGPAVQSGSTGRVAVWHGGREVAPVEFRTVVLP